MKVFEDKGSKEHLIKMFESVNKVKISNSNKSSVSKKYGYDQWGRLIKPTRLEEAFGYYQDSDALELPTGYQDQNYNPEDLNNAKRFYLERGINIEELSKDEFDSIMFDFMNQQNESFDNPVEKDKEYLDNSVDTGVLQQTKYDDGTRYPVEDKFKVSDPSLEKMKGDDAPIEEKENNEDEPTTDQIEGGLADDASVIDFDPDQIIKGLKVEMEHTNDPKIALEITMDHLTENPQYYGEENEDPDIAAMDGAREDLEKNDTEGDEEKEILWGKMDTIGDDNEDLEFKYEPKKIGGV